MKTQIVEVEYFMTEPNDSMIISEGKKMLSVEVDDCETTEKISERVVKFMKKELELDNYELEVTIGNCIFLPHLSKETVS